MGVQQISYSNTKLFMVRVTYSVFLPVTMERVSMLLAKAKLPCVH